MAYIVRNPVKEPNLKCFIMRLLCPYASLLDASIEILTLSQFCGNNHMTLVLKLTQGRYNATEFKKQSSNN